MLFLLIAIHPPRSDFRPERFRDRPRRPAASSDVLRVAVGPRLLLGEDALRLAQASTADSAAALMAPASVQAMHGLARIAQDVFAQRQPAQQQSSKSERSNRDI
jgi:hypothetical protein